MSVEYSYIKGVGFRPATGGGGGGGLTNGDKGDIIVSGGGSTLTLDASVRPNTLQVEVDFGATSTDSASLTVTGQTWVTTSSRILAAPACESTTDHDAEDAALEELKAYVSNLIAGTGFDVTVKAPHLAFGKFKVNIIGI